MSAMKRAAALRLAAAAALLVAAGCSSVPTPSREWIPKEELPNPLLYVPPPPAEGSATKAWDRARHEEAKALRTADPARAELAARDAVFTWENLFESFSPAYGRAISDAETPALCAALRFGLNTTRRAYRDLKRTYARKRPFAELGEPPLRPEDTKLGADSYPSGHAATAWAAALILSEVRPAAAEAVLARGFEAGESRLVCGVHWASDVERGRLVAGVAVARLNVDPDFRALLDAALREEAALPAPPAPAADPAADPVANPATETNPATGANP